ncbi:zinc ribbon domain-containing protein [Rossellomorea aquimaris]|uniref:zinc ribbon domain-containing protein n=1 Tax=Rossellomorea aquimaris TaxID=189382 RepID=UPI0005CB115E|nr:zinc ribbon domain-containing protein [Rossellomorea aquimaris]
MKPCNHCGHPLSKDSGFCRNCGNPVISEKSALFCKLCGTLFIADNEECLNCKDPNEKKQLSFCKECGSEQTDGECQRCKSVSPFPCKKCGSPLPSADLPCDQCTEPTRRRVHSKSTWIKRKSTVFSLILLVILLGAGTYGFWYVKDASLPVHTTKSLTSAIKSKDLSAVRSLLEGTHPEEKISRLLTDLHSDPALLAKLYKNLSDQEKVLTSKEQTDPVTPIVFQLKKSPEKKWGLIDQYSLHLTPITLTIQTDPDAKLFVNNVEVPPSGTDLRQVENLLPGEISVKAVKTGEYGEFETNESFPLWETNTTPMLLSFQDQYVTVSSEKSGVDVYLNGELYGTLDGTDMKIGPITAGDSVTISGVYHYPWGDVTSEEYRVGATEEVELLFPIPSETIRDQVVDAVTDYNQSYIEAITILDSSVLRSVKGPKLEETIGIINDLKQRRITYGGYIKELIFDGQSFTLEEEGTKARISVAEHYESSWNDPSDAEAATFKPKTYYFTYECEFDSDTNEWVVVDSKEHKGLTIADPL